MELIALIGYWSLHKKHTLADNSGNRFDLQLFFGSMGNKVTYEGMNSNSSNNYSTTVIISNQN
jgi:hypothetical protein